MSTKTLVDCERPPVNQTVWLVVWQQLFCVNKTPLALRRNQITQKSALQPSASLSLESRPEKKARARYWQGEHGGTLILEANQLSCISTTGSSPCVPFLYSTYFKFATFWSASWFSLEIGKEARVSNHVIHFCVSVSENDPKNTNFEPVFRIKKIKKNHSFLKILIWIKEPRNSFVDVQL